MLYSRNMLLLKCDSVRVVKHITQNLPFDMLQDVTRNPAWLRAEAHFMPPVSMREWAARDVANTSHSKLHLHKELQLLPSKRP